MHKRPVNDLVPQLTLDCVIFGFHEGDMKVLLLRWKGTQEWSLPGGPILQRESIDEAAVRVLRERTCLDHIYLKQFHTFGDYPRYDLNDLRDRLSHIIDPEIWYERAISVAYYALVDYELVSPTPDLFTEECRWWDIASLPALLFDHTEIIQTALHSLRTELSYQPVGLNLLPDKFTIPELRRLYETILNRPLDPRNFARKIKTLGILKDLGEIKKGGAHKAPNLYSFNKKVYQQKLQQGDMSFL